MYIVTDKMYDGEPQYMTIEQLKALAEKVAHEIALNDADYPHDYKPMKFSINDPQYIIDFLNLVEYDVVEYNN